METSAIKTGTIRSQDPARTQDDGPLRTRAGWLNELFARWISNSARGRAIGYWLSKTIALPQLRRLAVGTIPWAPPLQK